MSENGGCIGWIGLISLIVALLIWINNVDTLVVKEQIPPPQDSWDVVLPTFRDEVSAQLLNTQKMIGTVITGSQTIQNQNNEIQYSIDLLLSELGVIQKKAEEESKRQRIEQWSATILSIVLGWLLAAFVPTEETLINIKSIFIGKTELGQPKHHPTRTNLYQARRSDIPLWEFIWRDKFAIFSIIAIIILSIGIAILLVIEYIL